jgi:Mg2+ and Co2+ transporter CorA
MIGLLSPQALAASLMDWHLGAFFDEVSRIEAAVEKLDERVLRETAHKALLGRLVAMRRRVAKLRALLVSQRDVFYGLSRPDFALITDAGATGFYQSLSGRFERALDEVERARDLVTGSFELFTSRSSQLTNDLVKILTFVTAIIGFCAAVAGLFGMNFEVSVFKSGYAGFVAVTSALVLLSLLSVMFARRRQWI